jgi:hypothetical protein
MSIDLSAQIQAAATGPDSATVDGVTVSGPSPLDLIKAEQYLAARGAAALKHRGLRFTRLRPPGAVTTCNNLTTGCCCP